MVKRWIAYLAVWFCCLILYLLQRQWVCFFLLGMVTTLPLLSLLLISPSILHSKADILLPPHATMGDEICPTFHVTCQGPAPLWQAKIKTEHSYFGKMRPIKPNESLPLPHCGKLLIHLGGVYLYDHLGLFRFRIAAKQELSVAIRPTAILPDPLPDLGNHVGVRWIARRGGGFSENHDLRLYRPGDNLQQIHWKLSAKTGNLILREPLEPIHSRVLLRLDLKGNAGELDQNLGQLLGLSQFLLSKNTPHQWQVMTALGIQEFSVMDEKSLYDCLDVLLGCDLAGEGTVLDTPSNAAWWYYIGGDSHEEA